MAKSKEVLEQENENKGKNVEKKSNKKDKDKNKKPNFFVRIGRKFKETFSELKRVSWPTLPQALKATGVVLVIVLIFLVVVTGVNYGFSELLKLLTKIGSDLGV